MYGVTQLSANIKHYITFLPSLLFHQRICISSQFKLVRAKGRSSSLVKPQPATSQHSITRHLPPEADMDRSLDEIINSRDVRVQDLD